MTIIHDIQQMLSNHINLTQYQNRSSELGASYTFPPPSPRAATSPQPPSSITSDPSTDQRVLGMEIPLWQVRTLGFVSFFPFQ